MMNNYNLDKELLSIKEFSEIVGMTIETLRHYDNKGIFQPAKRGTEYKNHYRYYSPSQIPTIKMIRVLTEIGVPLETIKDLMEDRNPEILLKLFNKHRRIVADELRFLKEVHTIINMLSELLVDGVSANESEIYVSELPEKKLILGNVSDYSGASGFYREYMRFCSSLHNPKLNLLYPVGGYYDNIDVFLNKPSQPQRFFSLDPKGGGTKSEGLYLIGYTRGYYGEANDLPERMIVFAKKSGLEFNGPIYNLYLHDEICILDTDQYLSQVSASVREARRISESYTFRQSELQ